MTHAAIRWESLISHCKNEMCRVYCQQSGNDLIHTSRFLENSSNVMVICNTIRTLLLIAAAGGLLTGCKHQPTGPQDGGISPEPVIHAAWVSVSADVDHAVLDRPITITTSCMPVVTGKGVIGLDGKKINAMFDWTLIAPLLDTVSVFQDPYYTIYIPAEFTANQTFTQEWHVQLLKQTGPVTASYYFGAYAYIDSIFISDSNRMYWVYSTVARQYCPEPLGWQPSAVGNSFFLAP